MCLNNYSTCDSIAFEHWMVSKVIHYVDRVHHFTVTRWTFILCNYGCECLASNTSLRCICIWVSVCSCYYFLLFLLHRMFFVHFLLSFLVLVFHLVDTVFQFWRERKNCFILFRLLVAIAAFDVYLTRFQLLIDRFFVVSFWAVRQGYCIRTLARSHTVDSSTNSTSILMVFVLILK